ncbi:hypothetical protein [Streptomyces noursei]|uniref:hypothetical protein n=1 Tax=Streptomyces noursei TaxID=1971 RepID=UPI0011AF25F1|nr:hypothetical protein [Streptomyces noursei]
MAASESCLVSYPGQAVTWIRQDLRRLAVGMAEEDRVRATEWLDNLIAAGIAVRMLRAGSPFTLRMNTTAGDRWMWIAYRFVEAPLAAETGLFGSRTAQASAGRTVLC